MNIRRSNMGVYTKNTVNRTARPRSERLRKLGAGAVALQTAASAYSPSPGETPDWLLPYPLGEDEVALMVNPKYVGLFTEGWLSAGGVGSNAGGGGGGLIRTVYTWTELQALSSSPADDTTSTANAASSYAMLQMLRDRYTKSEVDQKIAAVTGFEYVIVDRLPAASASTMYKIYLTPATSSSTGNIKDEYITIYDSSAYKWEKIGSTAIDITGKADKVNGATTGHLAGLDSSGNLTDSGHSPSDFALASSLSGYVTIGTPQEITGAKTFSNTIGNSPNWSISSEGEADFVRGYFTGNLSTESALSVGGNAGVDGALSVNGDGYFDSSLTANGILYAYDNIEASVNLVMAASSKIDIGPVRIEYDSQSSALHITTNVTTGTIPVIGLYADGFVSAGGVGSGGSGGGSLAGLTDVELSNSLDEGDLLKYNGTHWVNVPQSQIVPTISVTNYGATLSAGQTVTLARVSGTDITAVVPSFLTTVALSNVTGADDLKAIEALTGTSGLLRKTAANTWSLDTKVYAEASSLSGYLPLTGGTLTGPLNITPSTTSALTSDGLDFGAYAHIGSATGTNGNLGLYSKGTIYLRPGNGSQGSDYGIVLGYDTLTYNGNNIWHAGNLDPMRVYQANATGKYNYYWVKITNTSKWAGSFCVKIYDGYYFEIYEIGGYNYQTGWYNPRVRLLQSTSSSRTSVSVYFGYTSASSLWFAIPTINTGSGAVHRLMICDYNGNYLLEDRDFSCTITADVPPATDATEPDENWGTTQDVLTATSYLSPSTGVTVATDQDISGTKTFTSGIVYIKTATGGTPTLVFQRGTLTDNYVDWKIQSAGGLLNFIYEAGGTDNGKVSFSSSAIRPHNDTVTSKVSTMTLGTEDQQWGNVFSAIGTFSEKLVVNNTAPTIVLQRGTASDSSSDFKITHDSTNGFRILRSVSGTDTEKLKIGATTTTISNEVLVNETIGGPNDVWFIGDDGAASFSSVETGGIKIGNAYLVYDSDSKALHVYGTDSNTAIGLYCDGWVSAGGVGNGGSASGTLENLLDVEISSTHESGDLLRYNGTKWVNVPQSSIVPTISVVVPSTGNALTGVSASGGTLTFTTGTFLTSYTETDPVFTTWKNGSQTKNRVWAAPSSANGSPSFRALVAADIPSITKSKISDFPTTWAWSSITGTPTTLSGYGITDAKIANGVITLGSNSITPLTSVPDLSSTYLSLANGGTVSGNVRLTGWLFGGPSSSTSWSVNEDGEASFASVSIGGVSVAPSSYVTKTGADTISGAKTFTTNNITLTGISIVPSADNTCYIGSAGTGGKRVNSAYIRNVYLSRLDFRDDSTGQTGYGYIGAGTNYYQFNFSTGSVNYMLYSDASGFFKQGGGVDLGGSSHRWRNVYSVAANLSGDLTLASSSSINIGPVTISYDSNNFALRISGVDPEADRTVGFYCDGWISAGGVGSSGGGGTITVDDALSSTSENPVQNKVIYAAIGDVESLLAAL